MTVTSESSTRRKGNMAINWSDFEIELAARLYEREANQIGYSVPTMANKQTQEQCSEWNVKQRDELQALTKRSLARASIFVEGAKAQYGKVAVPTAEKPVQQRSIIRPKED